MLRVVAISGEGLAVVLPQLIQQQQAETSHVNILILLRYPYTKYTTTMDHTAVY